MADTEPVTVEFQAETKDLETGTEAARQAIRGVGDEADVSTRKFKLFSDRGLNLLATFLALRGAIAITTDIMKELGINTEQADRIQKSFTLALNIGVAALGIYKSAVLIKAAVDFFAAKAAFLHGIANVSATTLFVGTAAAVGASLVAWAIIEGLKAPRAQFGGVVPARPGGTLVRVGEAGRSEAIIPLGGGTRGGGVSIDTINLNVTTDNPDRVMEVLARRIQRLKAAGF